MVSIKFILILLPHSFQIHGHLLRKMPIHRPPVSKPEDDLVISVRAIYEEQLAASPVAFVRKKNAFSGADERKLGEDAEKGVFDKEEQPLTEPTLIYGLAGTGKTLQLLAWHITRLLCTNSWGGSDSDPESESGSESEKSESSEGSLGWEIDHAWDESMFSMLPVGVPRATVRTSAISPNTFVAYREEDQFGVGPRGRNLGQDEQWDGDFV